METDLRYPLPLWKCWLLIIAESPINGDVFKMEIKKYLMSPASFKVRYILHWSVDFKLLDNLHNWMHCLAGYYIDFWAVFIYFYGEACRLVGNEQGSCKARVWRISILIFDFDRSWFACGCVTFQHNSPGMGRWYTLGFLYNVYCCE